MERYKPHLTERNSKIDVHQFASRMVDQNIRTVSITYTNDVADDVRNCQASAVCKSHGEPGQRLLFSFGEKMSHDGMEPLAIVLENGDEFLVSPRVFGVLDFPHTISELLDWHVTRVISSEAIGSLMPSPFHDRHELTLRALPADNPLEILFALHIVSSLSPRRESQRCKSSYVVSCASSQHPSGEGCWLA
jgi:hypothetical protein